MVLETEQERLELVLRTLEHHKVGAPVRFATRPVSVLGAARPARGRGPGGGGRRRRCPRASTRTARPGSATSRCGSSAPATCPGGGFVLHAAPEQAGRGARRRSQAAGAVADRRRGARRAARRGALPVVRHGRERGQPAPRDRPRGRAPLLHQGLLRGPGGDRAARGARRQREQGAARPAARRARERRGAGDGGRQASRLAHDLRGVAAARADRDGLRPPQPLRSRQRGRGGRRPGPGRR